MTILVQTNLLITRSSSTLNNLSCKHVLKDRDLMTFTLTGLQQYRFKSHKAVSFTDGNKQFITAISTADHC